MKRIICTLAVAAASYAAVENKCMLSVRKEYLGKGEIKVIQISDLHKRSFGRDNIYLCEKVKKEAPDVILITGDLVSRSSKKFDVTEKTLKSLCGIAPVYMIYGNHEQSIYEENVRAFTEMLGRTDVVLLKNEFADVCIKGRKIKIYGILEDYSTYKKNERYRDLDVIEKADIVRLIGKRPEGEVWLMAHNPIFGKAYAEWGADAVFSGHIHGGAVRLFNIGILSPERKFFPKYSKGVYEIGKTKLLVSAGLGKLRCFDPPEIVEYYM